MRRTLVTLLGRARRRDGETGYEEATYRFPDGATDRSPFFGLALARHLRPDEVVILGTAGSQWSVLMENLAEGGDEDEEARIELMSAEECGSVGQPLLDRHASLLARAMDADMRPILISAATGESDQYAILEAVDQAVVGNGGLHFDLTHGFRHLGMVGLLSSFMLERVRPLHVEGLWYGAFDMRTSDVVPVLRLDGLTRVRRWLDALDRFDATGDYGVFAPLLQEDGVPADKAKCLEDAAFFERTLNIRDAARKVTTFLPVLDGALAGASGLFQHRLRERLRWAQAQPPSEQQRKLAQQYLRRGDFVRAAMFGREACVSRLCEDRGVTTLSFGEERQQVVDRFRKEVEGVRRQGFESLNALRNALAHGTRPTRRRVRAALREPNKLSSELRSAMQRFFA